MSVLDVTPTDGSVPRPPPGSVQDGRRSDLADSAGPPAGPSSRRWPLLALALLLSVAAVVRLGLLLREWPASNSDEGTMGLMAIRIAEGRDLPSFMDGQSYMGTLEAYLAAPLFRVFGPSLMALRLPMVLMFLLFLAAVSVLARRLYGTAVALASVGVLALGSRELYGHQLIAQGAIPETLLGGTLLLLLGHRLLELPGDPGRAAGQRWRLAGWGATATLGLWSSALIAPFVLTSAVLVRMAMRRPAFVPGRWWALGGGLLVGALPWALHDVSHPWRDSGALGAVNAYLHGGTGLDGRSAGLGSQLVNTVTTSLAYITAGSGLAHPSSRPAWPYGYAGSWHPPTDDVASTLWGIGWIALWAAGSAACLRAVRHRRRAPARHGADRRAWAQVCGRSAMLAAAGLTVAAFVASPAPGVAPANNVRYLIGVLVATPAVIAPLWSLRSVAPRTGAALRSAVLVLVAVTLTLGTAQAYRDAGRDRSEAGTRRLIDTLWDRGISHVYSGYLDCNRLTFLSRERVTCAVLSGSPAGGLQPGFDRYLPYRTEVRADPWATYAFRAGDPRNAPLARSSCRWRSGWQAPDYVIWQPADPCPIPGPPVGT